MITSQFQKRSGTLISASCTKAGCGAVYYPDHYTRPDPQSDTPNRLRLHYLEYNSPWLKVSRKGVFAHLAVARLQESTTKNLHSGWQQFARFINEMRGDPTTTMTDNQSYRLFAENFARRLLKAHRLTDTFSCPAPAGPKQLIQAVLALISPDGNGGVVPGGLQHTCMDCVHRKRYASDDSVTSTGSAAGVADVEGTNASPVSPACSVTVSECFSLCISPQNLVSPEGLSEIEAQAAQFSPPQLEAPPEGTPRGWIRAVVMDGKTISHRVRLQVHPDVLKANLLFVLTYIIPRI